ncbi:transposase [Kyrpidia spormannii]|nr:transposase [Kyrpidia spormannii]
MDRRIFTPIARESYKWAKECRHRAAVERVNSRLDVSFGFERHTVRGLGKMRLRCGLALCVMLAMALGRGREKRQERMRSLVRSVS